MSTVAVSARMNFRMRWMHGIVKALVDQQEPTPTHQHPPELPHRGIDIREVVHHIDRPRRIDAGLGNREMFSCAVAHLDALARALHEPSHAEHRAQERRRLDGDHPCTDPRGEHGSGTHTGTDVDHALPRPHTELVDHNLIDG